MLNFEIYPLYIGALIFFSGYIFVDKEELLFYVTAFGKTIKQNLQNIVEIYEFSHSYAFQSHIIVIHLCSTEVLVV